MSTDPVLPTHSSTPTGLSTAAAAFTAPPTTSKVRQERANLKLGDDCSHRSSKRNLVVCLDGTANQFSAKNTNVVELYSRLEKSAEQMTYYDSGIGTYVKADGWSHRRIKQWFDNKTDQAIAWNFKRMVLSAYQWLSENYEEGDRIFLFGFSRGAYQIRVIAGMIEKVGLLHKGNNNQIAFAYELYAATTKGEKRAATSSDDKLPQNYSGKQAQSATHTSSIVKEDNGAQASSINTNVLDDGPSSAPLLNSDSNVPGDQSSRKHAPSTDELCEKFKNTLCSPDVKVHHAGAWDTVSSVGFARKPSLPETTSGMAHVCAFRHALALDELRVKFLPEYADGGAGPSGGGNVKEVWFAGSHSDIGGGNVDNLDLNHFGPALRWMAYEAIQRGLKMKPYLTSHNTEWSAISHPTKSLVGFWRPLEYFFFRRLSYEGKDKTTSRQHRGAPRVVLEGQQIHNSVFEAMKDEKKVYQPRATINTKKFKTWSDLAPLELELKEADPYVSAEVVLSSLQKSDSQKFTDGQFDVLSTQITTELGRRSITEFPGALAILFSSLEAEYQTTDANEPRGKIVNVLAKALAAFPPQHIMDRKYPYSLIEKLVPENSDTRKEILRRIGKWPFWGHTDFVLSIAYSPDGNRIVSGSDDRTIRVWDAMTGEHLLGPFEGNTGRVWSVAYSPAGNRIVSGSEDHMVRVWDAKTGKQATRPLEGHTGPVQSVAYSPDGELIVSGSDDRIVREWDATRKSGKPVAGLFEGHKGGVIYAVYSPNGEHIASCSDDHTIRVWDKKTCDLVLGPLEGHTDKVISVAFSLDGKHVASGSWDKTIKLWDAGTGNLVGELLGHEDSITSVGYSPHGRYVVSGSDDCTIRVWDTKTGKMTAAGVFKGHHGPVNSVVYSPDGKRIASASIDGTIRVWDAKTGEQLLGPIKD